MLESKFRSCYIAAPFGVDISGLTQALDRRQVDWRWADSRKYQTSAALGDIRHTIRGVDVVLAVFPGPNWTGEANVVFEAGLAVGIGKPVIAVSSGPRTQPTLFDLSAVPTIYSESPSFTDIDFQLDIFLGSIQRPYWPRSRPTPHYIENLKAWRHRPVSRAEFSSAFEYRVVSLLEPFCDQIEAGLAVATPTQGYQADALAWIRGLEFGSPNLPVLVEVKEQAAPSRDAALVRQMADNLERLGLIYALCVVRGSREPKCIAAPLFGFIYLFGSDEFELFAQRGSLVDELVLLRNRAAHGEQ